MLRAIITIFLFQIASTAWASTYLKWYSIGTSVYCGEYTPQNDLIGDVDASRCRELFPTHIKWYKIGSAVYCGDYTPAEDRINDVDPSNCKLQFPTYTDWYKIGSSVYCGEYTPQGWRLNDADNDICRGNAGVREAAKPVLKIEDVNRNLQPPEGSQVILAGDLAVPRNQGCAAPKDTDKTVQCYVCQAQSSRNSMLYTKDGILGIGAVQMLESRNEIRITLVDSDDLGSIRCMTKNKAQIPIYTLEDLMKALDLSGLKFKDPGYVVKTIGAPRSEQ